VLKLAGTDRIRGGNTRLYFYVGSRVRKYAGESLVRDKKLTGLLSCPPGMQGNAVEKISKQSKLSLKALKSLRSQLAPLVARDLHGQLLAQADFELRAVVYHCEHGDGPFINSIGAELAGLMAGSSGQWLAVVASGARADGGPLVVAGGEEAAISSAVAQLAPLLGECKGGLARGVWQGKAGSFVRLDKFSPSTYGSSQAVGHTTSRSGRSVSAQQAAAE
ncbi:hypothetical protein GGI02_005805, partial [Coemansia sp. RSA 2322]